MNRAQIEIGVQELYIGILGRAADYTGLKYWADEISSGKQTLENTRASFSTPKQAEYWNIYGGLSNTALVEKVYQNFLERAPDGPGKAYWVAELDSGKIKADFFVNAVINAAKDSSTTNAQTLIDAKVLANKVQSAIYFTEKTKTANSKDNSFIAQAKAAVDSVNSDIATLNAANSASDEYALKLPAPSLPFYDDRAVDAGGSISTATNISLTTNVSGVVGLRYDATTRDNSDVFKFTVANDGYISLNFSGHKYTEILVRGTNSKIMDSYVTSAVNKNPSYTYTEKAKVFANEVVTIIVTGSGSSGVTEEEYNFNFSML